MLVDDGSIPGGLRDLHGPLHALVAGKPGVALVRGEEPVAGLSGHARRWRGEPSETFIGAEKCLNLTDGFFESLLGNSVGFSAKEERRKATTAERGGDSIVRRADSVAVTNEA